MLFSFSARWIDKRPRQPGGLIIPVNNVDLKYSGTTIKNEEEKDAGKNEKLETRRVEENEGEKAMIRRL